MLTCIVTSTSPAGPGFRRLNMEYFAEDDLVMPLRRASVLVPKGCRADVLTRMFELWSVQEDEVPAASDIPAEIKEMYDAEQKREEKDNQ